VATMSATRGLFHFDKIGNSSAPTINHDFAVARYNSNGSLDTSFDGDGKASSSEAEEAKSK